MQKENQPVTAGQQKERLQKEHPPATMRKQIPPLSYEKKTSSSSSSSSSKRMPTSTIFPFQKLPSPTVLFSNHHLLVVHKPAGWHSVPQDQSYSKSRSKCLLTYLKEQRLGGGSALDYLKPVHRLDQPCTGLLVLAKNTKAASRIQKAWGKYLVQKEYYCVVESSMQRLQKGSIPLADFQDIASKSPALSFIQKNSNTNKRFQWGDEEWKDPKTIRALVGLVRKSQDGNRSVHVTAISNFEKYAKQEEERRRNTDGDDSNSDDKRQRRHPDGAFCFLEYRHLSSFARGELQAINTNSESRSSMEINAFDQQQQQETQYHLLAIRTNTGMRHQIRALLAAVGGCPVVGDLRYRGSQTMEPLPDRSVALHARAIYIPTVQLGGTALKNEPFVAPIPETWQHYFGLTEDQVTKGKG